MDKRNSGQSGTYHEAVTLVGSIPPPNSPARRTFDLLNHLGQASDAVFNEAMKLINDCDKELLLQQAIDVGSQEDLRRVLTGIKEAPFRSGCLPLCESLILRAVDSDPATFESALLAGYGVMDVESSAAQTEIVMTLLLSEDAHAKIALALTHDDKMPLLAKLAANSLMESMDTSAALLRVGPSDIDPEIERINDVADTTTIAVAGLMSLIRGGADVDVPRIARTIFEPFRSGTNGYHPDLLAVRADLLEQVKNEVSDLPDGKRGYVAAVMLNESLVANAAALRNDSFDQYTYDACVDFRSQVAVYADLSIPVGVEGISLSQMAGEKGVLILETPLLAMPESSFTGFEDWNGHSSIINGRN